MNRPPRLLASTLTAGLLLSTAACSGDGGGFGRTDVPASPAAKESQAASASASGTRTLTEAQAKTALITNTDLGSQWSETQGAATWRDALLKSKVDVAGFVTEKQNAVDCQRLLDGLYGEDLLGAPKGALAVTGFDDSDNDGQMRYQVAAYGQAAVDAKLAWLKTLPDKCAQFVATDNKGGKQNVEVISASAPAEGDARAGLQMTMNGQLEGEPSTLTLDIGVVRVGDSAAFLTNGGLDGAESDSTVQALQQGAQRLKDVLAGKSPAAQPPGQQD
jgi:hypothetical protein